MYHEHMRNHEEVWITSDSFNKWLTMEEAYLRLRNHWLVRLAIKLGVINEHTN